MDKQRVQAYYNLIDQLLKCPSGKEPEILQQNSQLIDEDFLQAANYYAQRLQEEGKEQPAAFLFNLVKYLLENFNSPVPSTVYRENSSISHTRYQAYIRLIQELLQSSGERGQQILLANRELLDAGLIETMEQVAAEFNSQGNPDGDLLTQMALNLSQYMEVAPAGQADLSFLLDVLEAIGNDATDSQIYHLLEVNLDRVNLRLVQILQIWADDGLDDIFQKREQIPIGTYIHRFSQLISEFPLGNPRHNIEIALTGYQVLLRIFTRTNYPNQWASVQINIGNTYVRRITGSKEENVETAIESFNNALEIITAYNAPQKWAMIHNNLGAAYRNRIAGHSIENIELAIGAYSNVLEIYNRIDFPEKWAMTNNNLGVAYKKRIKGDRKENIESAIEAFVNALEVYSKAEYPIDWAMSQSNLGVSYAERIAGKRKDNLELAIVAYTKALEVYTEEDFPQKWATIQNNLGNAYSNRLAGDKKIDIEIAITCFRAALRVFTRLHSPENWAAIYADLGIAHLYRRVEKQEKNLELAFFAFTRALEVYTKESYLQQWADTQSNLGAVYYYKAKLGEDRQNNVNLAIASFTNALQIDTPQSNSNKCVGTSTALGNVQFGECKWQSAIDAYKIAIEAVEQSREWAANDQNKQEVISNAIEVYQNIVQACINLGQIDKAIEYVERGKARNLVDLLSTKDLYPKGDIPEEMIVRLRTLRQEKIVEERRLSLHRSLSNSFNNFDSEENRSFTDLVSRNKALDTKRLNLIRQELDKLIAEHIEPIDPIFKLTCNRPFLFKQIQSTLPTQQTALIEWFIGNDTFSAFIVTSQRSTPVHLEYTEEQFQTLVEIANQYYGLYRQRDGQWHSILPDLLTQLAQSLQIEQIIEQIRQLIPNYNQLILVPHRWLHLLPVHALPLSDGKCFLDLFPKGVSYAPSVQLLQITQIQNKPQQTKFFAVQNPTEDLEFTNIEVQSIRTQFQPHDDVLIEKQATKSTLLNQATLGQANLAHFSCHGYFNFENPELSALLMAGSKVDKEEGEGEDKEEKNRFLPSRDGGNIDLRKCLTLGEIFSLDLPNCRLVTLSACETGLTDFKSLSDEYIGLPSGFLCAGSPSVVSSLWAVSDLSTTFLMVKFYQNFRHINSVPIALNQAQLWLRNLTRDEFKKWSRNLPLRGEQRANIDARFRDNTYPFASPYHWAAFCAVGS